MNQTLNPEVVVITGASAGVGRAVAIEFARHGAQVALIARNAERLESAKNEIERHGGTALSIPADVADAEQVEAAAQLVEDTLGPIDIWVNAAMVTIYAMFDEITPEEFRRVTEVTYLGYVHGTRAALKRMRPRDHGTIVQVGSALAYRAIPLQSAYCGAKFAIRGFTDAVRCELLHRKSRVHITMVQLPAVNTPQFDWARVRIDREPRPVAPVYQPEVVARAVHWAAHHRRRELNLGISSAAIIPVNKMFPGLLDRYLARTAISGQMTGQPLKPDRPDNMFTSPDGDFGARGRFDNEAKAESIQFMISKHRGWMAAGVGLALAWMMVRRA